MKKVPFIILFLFFFAGIVVFGLFASMNMKELNKDLISESQEIKKIHFIHWGSFPEELFKRFNEKYPGISVDFERFDEEQYVREQKTRVAASYNVDLMGIRQNDFARYVHNSDLVDLSNMSFLDNYTADTRAAVKKLSGNGKEYAVAYRNWVLGIWYNKILFSRYGIKVPDNYQEFVAACEKLKGKDVTPVVLGGRSDWSSSYLFLLRISGLVNQDREWYAKLEDGRIKWTDSRMKAALKDINELLGRGYIKEDSKYLTNQQAFIDFSEGKAAMTIMSDWSVSLVKQDLEKVCDPGVFPIPFADSGDVHAVPGCQADFMMGIYSKSGSVKETQLLLDFLSRSENAQLYADITMTIPAIIGVDTGKLKYYNLWEPLKNMEHLPMGVPGMPEEFQKKINRDAKLLMDGQTDYMQVLTGLQQLQEKRLR